MVLTSRSGPGTLGRRLYDQPSLKSVTLELKQRVKLEGDSLDIYLNTKTKESKYLFFYQVLNWKSIEEESAKRLDFLERK